MKSNKISTKIKTIGMLFLILIISILITTIYLNKKNEKDALVINIAGKERMLTQKMSKAVFYSFQTKNYDFSELNYAIEEFIYNLESLKNGNDLIRITKVPTDTIAKQLSKVEVLWNNFHKNIQTFKKLSIEKNLKYENLIKLSVDEIYKTNNNLLNEVDALVTMYTVHSEKKTLYVKYFQYVAGIMLLILIIYVVKELKKIEANAQNFLNFSKKVIENPDNTPLEPIEIKAEAEITQATDTLNCFIAKVNSAMDYSTMAIEQSKNASTKLEEITSEFDKVLDELKDSKVISQQLDKSEDMVIESTEELINSTKKLQNLRDELDKLLKSCKAV